MVEILRPRKARAQEDRRFIFVKFEWGSVNAYGLRCADLKVGHYMEIPEWKLLASNLLVLGWGNFCCGGEEARGNCEWRI